MICRATFCLIKVPNLEKKAECFLWTVEVCTKFFAFFSHDYTNTPLLGFYSFLELRDVAGTSYVTEEEIKIDRLVIL